MKYISLEIKHLLIAKAENVGLLFLEADTSSDE